MDKFNLFESFLSGMLSKSDSDMFLLKLNSDAEFKSDFELHKQMQNAMDIFVEEDVRSVISGLDNANTNRKEEATIADEKEFQLSPETIASKAKLRNLIIACVFTILAGLFAWSYFGSGTNSVSNPINEYYAAYEPEVQRSDSNPLDIYELYGKEINQLVKDQNWQLAAQKLKTLMENTSGSIKDEAEWNWVVVTAQFDPSLAKSTLDIMMNNSNHLYYNEPEALNFLKFLQE